MWSCPVEWRKTRPVADCGGHAKAFLELGADRLKNRPDCRVHGEVGLDRQIVARFDGAEPFPDVARQRVGLPGSNLGGWLPLVAGAFHGLLSQGLGKLHIRLIERMDAEHGPCGGCSHLCPEHLRGEIIGLLEDDPGHRVTGVLEQLQGSSLFSVLVSIEGQVDEETVRTVGRRWQQSLAGDRDDPLAVLAG